MTKIKNLIPNCKCSACILTPESSHGIYMVGIYRPATFLASRGHALPEAVSIPMYGRLTERATYERGMVVPLTDSLCDGTMVTIP